MSFVVIISLHSILPLWFYSILITLSGDVETTPGTKRNSTEHIHFVIGISIVSLLIIMLIFFYSNLT